MVVLLCEGRVDVSDGRALVIGEDPGRSVSKLELHIGAEP
jgi:hypothetical protein